MYIPSVKFFFPVSEVLWPAMFDHIRQRSRNNQADIPSVSPTMKRKSSTAYYLSFVLTLASKLGIS